MGKDCRDVSEENWQDAIVGYTTILDMTEESILKGNDYVSYFQKLGLDTQAVKMPKIVIINGFRIIKEGHFVVGMVTETI